MDRKADRLPCAVGLGQSAAVLGGPPPSADRLSWDSALFWPWGWYCSLRSSQVLSLPVHRPDHGTGCPGSRMPLQTRGWASPRDGTRRSLTIGLSRWTCPTQAASPGALRQWRRRGCSRPRGRREFAMERTPAGALRVLGRGLCGFCSQPSGDVQPPWLSAWSPQHATP